MRRKKNGGFTLVELVIVIAIVIVLSVVSVPIYRSYVDKAKLSEGYALLGAIMSAQKAYYSEYGYFYCSPDNTDGHWSSYYPALGVDARGNKYFTIFFTWSPASYNFKGYNSGARKPVELWNKQNDYLCLDYNISKGALFSDGTYNSAHLS